MSLLYATAPNEVQEEDAEALQRALQPAALPSTAAAAGATVGATALDAAGAGGQGAAHRLGAVSAHNAAVARALLQWEQSAQDIRESPALFDGDMSIK